MIGGCAKVVQDVAPFMLVDGNPAETRTINKVGLERNGVSEPKPRPRCARPTRSSSGTG